jgi:hypothetical protein
VGNLDIDMAWQPTIQLRDGVDSATIAGSGKEELSKEEVNRLKNVSNVKSRLNSMLACQYNFGTSIGTPSILCIGSFVYPVVAINRTLGDTDYAHALGSGLW